MVAEIEKIFKEISGKLSVLISLSLENKELLIKDKVELLSRFNITNKDIAKILNISEIHVAKEKSLIKRRRLKNERERV